MSNYQIEVTLVAVARKLVAEPGDQLIVAGDTVTGVIRYGAPPRCGTEPSPSPGPVAALAPPLQPSLELQPERQPQRPIRPRRLAHGAAATGPSDQRKRTADAMRQLLRERGGVIRAVDLPRALGDAAGKPWHLRGAIADLLQAGQITAGGKHGKGRVYRLS